MESCYEQIKGWEQKWQAAMDAGVFADAPKAPRPALQDRIEDYQDFQRHRPSVNPKVDDGGYWDLIAKAAKNPNDAPDVIEYLMEQDKYTNNPVYPVTYGKDQEPVVTPNWINGEDLEKLIKIKLDLHELGDKYAAAEATMDPKAKGLWGQIKSLGEKLDELSDALTPTKEKEALS